MRLVLPTDKSESEVDPCGLWVTLHAVYRQWALARPEAVERGSIAAHIERQLEGLGSIPCQDWKALLTVQGVTPLGLAMLSWTKDAELKDIMETWGAIYEQAKDAPESALEGIHFTNPDLLPEPSFSAFVETGFNQQGEWKFFAIAFKGREIDADNVPNLNPEIMKWFMVKPQ